MESQGKKLEQIELTQLDLRYAHTRVFKEKELVRMQNSLQRFGQIAPVVVTKGQAGVFVLMDGYKRVTAFKQIRAATVWSEIWDMDEEKALLAVLARDDARRWEAVEQAAVIQELHQTHQFSISEIARRIGRHKSWVKRKLDLLAFLPEEILKAVLSGRISIWAASRIMVPLARANASQAKILSEKLEQAPLSTRHLAAFYEHYKEANREVREKMIEDPHLFIKALSAKEGEAEAAQLQGGPEKAFLKDLKIVNNILKRLVKQAAKAVYPGQDPAERRMFKRYLFKSRDLLSQLEVKIAEEQHDQRAHQGNDLGNGGKGACYKGNQPPDQSRPEHDPGDHQRPKRLF